MTPGDSAEESGSKIPPIGFKDKLDSFTSSKAVFLVFRIDPEELVRSCTEVGTQSPTHATTFALRLYGCFFVYRARAVASALRTLCADLHTPFNLNN